MVTPLHYSLTPPNQCTISINFLQLTVPEILPGQDCSRYPPTHPNGENYTHTAFKLFSYKMSDCQFNGFIYLGFYVAFNTVQVISRLVVGRAEETSTYSSLGFCTVNCRPTASNYQLSHLRPCRESNPGLRGGSLMDLI